MKNNTLEKVIFILLRVFGILGILGGFLGEEGYFEKGAIGNGHVYFMNPLMLVAMVASIIVYLFIIKLIQKHISIAVK